MDWTAHARDALTLQGDIYNAMMEKECPSDRMRHLMRPLSMEPGSIRRQSPRSLETHYKRGSDVQLQTYYDRTNRREASFGESRDTFDIDFLHH